MQTSFKQLRLEEADAADFDWFDLTRYDDLSSYGYRQWHDLVFDRIQLSRIIHPNTHEVVTEHLRQLKTEPLANFGSHQLHGDLDNPVNSGSVKMLLTDQVRQLGRELENAPPNRPVDDFLMQQSPRPEFRVAHFAVLMDGTNAQILADFKTTLLAYRKFFGDVKNKDYVSAMAEWVAERVVPYFDLTLIAKVEGKTIPATVMRQVLYREYNDYKWDKIRRNVPPAAERLFSDATANILFAFSR